MDIASMPQGSWVLAADGLRVVFCSFVRLQTLSVSPSPTCCQMLTRRCERIKESKKRHVQAQIVLLQSPGTPLVANQLPGTRDSQHLHRRALSVTDR